MRHIGPRHGEAYALRRARDDRHLPREKPRHAVSSSPDLPRPARTLLGGRRAQVKQWLAAIAPPPGNPGAVPHER